MPNFLCLRDCFVWDRFHNEGQIYKLSTDATRYPKNFQLVEDTPEVSEELSIPTREKPRSPAKKYKRNVCGKVVSTRLALAGHSRSHKRE